MWCLASALAALSLLLVSFPSLPSASPQDEKFLKCCKSKGLPDLCQDYCNYDTKGTKNAAFFNQAFSDRRPSPCPLKNLPDYVYCMANGKDNRKCCEDRGLGSFAPDCLQFCNGADVNSIKVHRCLLRARLDIADCHRENAN